MLLSGGASNNINDAKLLGQQIDALVAKGVNPADIHVAGVGDRGDYRRAGLNDQLARIAKDKGAVFTGALDPRNLRGDHVHLRDYGRGLQQIDAAGEAAAQRDGRKAAARPPAGLQDAPSGERPKAGGREAGYEGKPAIGGDAAPAAPSHADLIRQQIKDGRLLAAGGGGKGAHVLNKGDGRKDGDAHPRDDRSWSAARAMAATGQRAAGAEPPKALTPADVMRSATGHLRQGLAGLKDRAHEIGAGISQAMAAPRAAPPDPHAKAVAAARDHEHALQRARAAATHHGRHQHHGQHHQRRGDPLDLRRRGHHQGHGGYLAHGVAGLHGRPLKLAVDTSQVDEALQKMQQLHHLHERLHKASAPHRRAGGASQVPGLSSKLRGGYGHSGAGIG